MNAADYEWVSDLDSWPGAIMSQGSCFTFVEGMAPEPAIHQIGATRVASVDLTGNAAGMELVNFEDRVAAFSTDIGWTVLYDAGYPDRYSHALLAQPTVARGVIVFWNINSVTEFSYWERGTSIVSFDFPFVRYGLEPDRLLAQMFEVGLAIEEPDDDIINCYPCMMALAERITGVRLQRDFLCRPVLLAELSSA